VSAPVTAFAYAKVTLSLRVVGVRDDGYHELDALVTSVNAPRDIVQLSKSSDTTVGVDGPTSAGVPTDERNLAARAASALGVTAAIQIHKEIPPGAGLGGGSADAAAVLMALQAIYRLEVTFAELVVIGARLGADVPACLRGGALRMQGVGDRLEPVTLPPLGLVIATPPFGCATPAVYAAWDDLGGPTGREVDAGVAGLPALANDLEPAAWTVEPRLESFRDELERAAGRPVLLAGSGSSYFVVCASPSTAETVAHQVGDAMGDSARIWAAATASSGVALKT
jgi:4-diphosphocytidyl-2-C-methyl-D-erythritol kinase